MPRGVGCAAADPDELSLASLPLLLPRRVLLDGKQRIHGVGLGLSWIEDGER